MTYKVGTRVKKVRNMNIGNTGIVVDDSDHVNPLGGRYDCYVKHDQPWVADAGDRWPAGAIARTVSSSWEPIVPEGQKPSEFSYEELLESLKEKEDV